MAVNPVPFCLANPTVEHSAHLVRQALSSLLNPAGGTVHEKGLTVSAKEPANMEINVANGGLWIPGTSIVSQSMYFASNDSTTALAIGAASEANPRIDTVVARIEDSFYAGGKDEFVLEVLPGTPTGGLVKAPKTRAEAEADKAAALPASCLVLAYILVPKSAASIVAGNIENVATQMEPQATTVGDASVVKGRALIAMEKPYGAPVSLEAGVEYEPNAFRETDVTLKAPGIIEKIFVGGIEIMGYGNGHNAFFKCPAKAKWRAICSTGEVSANYRVL